MLTFDSRDPRYRSPTGAVPAGASISFTVRPESSRFPLRGFLCLENDRTGERAGIEMEHLGEEEGSEVFAVSVFAGMNAGLFWYYFRFENEGGFFFYGNNRRKTGGKCEFYGAETPPAYQLTVYDADYESPEWFGQGVCYHIFPDRFCRLKVPDENEYAGRNRIIHSNWDDTPQYRPEGDGEAANRDFYGGSLAGIRSKLAYLKEMSVTCIYLSPVFEAFSNHRYDTADYQKIDPMLGTNEEFSLLCSEAKELGIRILLDGVFNHTGYDSIYFNAKGRYTSVGAYQSKESPYYSWYTFLDWPDDYLCWWNVKTLPKANALDTGYSDFIAGDGESVIRRWLAAGASGWRLDVADEIPDSFIRRINRAARTEKEDSVIIGEVWEDASNKISYGARRDYLLGGALDGVMNYPFRSAAIEFLKGGSSRDFREKMESLLENYPPYAVRSAMNIMGTHDTPRLLSVLGSKADVWRRNTEDRAGIYLNESDREEAKRLHMIGALLQFCFIGCPCIYYGDEAGMEGFEDPLNRRGFPWNKGDRQLMKWYEQLGKARKELASLRQGTIEFLDTDDQVIAFLRRFSCEETLAVCNRADSNAVLRIGKSNDKFADFMTGETIVAMTHTGEAADYCEIELRPQRAYLLIKSV